MQVSYLSYKQIDKAKWDECVGKSSNRLIYGFSLYLDKMAANWDGLVLNDYEAVMPLPWKKKLQVKYLYQPPFMQQGGIFSPSLVTSEIVNAFLSVAATNFAFAEITLNYGNDISRLNNNIKVRPRSNFVLQLSSYGEVSTNFKPTFKKSLRRIQKFGFTYEVLQDHSRIVRMYEELYGKHLPSFAAADYKSLLSICEWLVQDGKVITRVVYGADKKLVAGVVLLHDDNRLYNLISCITPEGRKLEANYFLYDNLIAEFCGQDLLLDLEGSEVKGIATFYKKMNPALQPYHFIKYNHLHPILKVFKK